MRSRRPRFAQMCVRKLVCSMGMALVLLTDVSTVMALPVVNTAGQQAPSSIAGEYQGTMGNQHLDISLAQSANGMLSGKLTLPDQGNATLPLDTVTYADGTLRFELKALSTSFEGKSSAAGDSFSGTWTYDGQNIPLTLRRPGAGPAAFTLAPRTIGSVAFQPCRTPDGNTEGLCGSYSVVENGTTKTGRKLALRIMILPALSATPAVDAFLPLAGGPGQSAIEAYTLAAYIGMIRRDRDVLLIDQRGTGGSAPLQCELRDIHNAQQVLGEEILPERLKRCREQLAQSADLTQYTTPAFADDLEEVRAALGYAQVDVFGQSYGTRAALEYLRRHGEHVRTLTLEGIVAPEYRIPVSFSRALQSSINRIEALCAADAVCRSSYPNLETEFRAVLERLDKQPITLTLKTSTGEQTATISRGNFVSDLRPVLYVPEAIRAFPMMVHSAYDGDFHLFATVALQIRSAVDRSINRDLSLSVLCSDDVTSTTPEMIRRDTANTYLGDFQVKQYQQYCAAWPHAGPPAALHRPIRSAVPAMLISGALDPVTPPEMSAELARNLPNSQMVILPNGTHGTGSACVDTMIADFVHTGGKVDSSCAANNSLGPFLTGHP